MLAYDGYRSHMGFDVLWTLVPRGVLPYALPSHTTATAQPLDAAVFDLFKSELNNGDHQSNKIDVFDFARMITTAFEAAFVSSNIMAGFHQTGLFPPDPSVHRQKSLPLSDEIPAR